MSGWAVSWAYEQAPGALDKNNEYDPEINNPGAKAVLVALASFCGDEKGWCWPSQKTLATMTDLSERSVRRHLLFLEEHAGLIRRVERRRKDGTRSADWIQLLAPASRLGPTRQPAKSTASDSSTGQHRQLNRTAATDQPATVSGQEPLVEPLKEPLIAEEALIEERLPDDTTTACLKILKKVEGFPRDQADNAIYLSELRTEFPQVDPVQICKEYETWHKDNPRKTKNYRGRLRNFFAQGISQKAKQPASRSKQPARDEVNQPSTQGANTTEAAARRTEGYEWMFEGGRQSDAEVREYQRRAMEAEANGRDGYHPANRD